MKQFELFQGADPPTGEQLRDRGMKQAIDHANDKYENWSEQAFSIFRLYHAINGIDPKGFQFMTEDLRAFAVDWGLPEPPSNRAWGSVIRRAAKEGLIKKVGYGQVKNPKAHQANAAVWELTNKINEP